MDFITLQDPRLLAWANRQVDQPFEPERCRWVGGLGPSGIAFVVVYSRFSPANCEMSIATDGSRRWATRRTLRGIFFMPFEVWGLRRVTFIVKDTNEKSKDMCARLGATVEGRIREGFLDCDAIVFGLLRTECQWIR